MVLLSDNSIEAPRDILWAAMNLPNCRLQTFLSPCALEKKQEVEKRIKTQVASRHTNSEFVSLHSSVVSEACNFDFTEGDAFLTELQETLHKLVCRIGMKTDMLFMVAVTR